MNKLKTIALIPESGLTTAIKAIKTKGAKLDHEIQVAALSACAIAAKVGTTETSTGNIHYVNALYDSMPKGSRHVALTAWLTTFGGMKANEGADKASKPFMLDDSKKLDIEGGTKTPWHSMKPSKKPDQVVDVYAMLLKVLQATGKEGAELKNQELIEPLKQFLEEHAPVEAETEELDGQ